MIVIITPPRTLPDEEHIVNKLFESGLHLLHLRKPGADRDTLEHYIRGIRPRFRERVILHDHSELAEEYGLRGIHLKYNEARTFTGRDRLAHVSVSCHSFEEIDALVFVEGEDDFAVRTRLKGVLSGVMCTDIAVVVYLTVDGKDLLAVGRVQRLPTRLRVDDRKPLVCKDCGAAYINTAPVRSAMADFLCHF